MDSDLNNDIFSKTTQETPKNESNDTPAEQQKMPQSPSVQPMPTKSKFEFNSISIILCIIVIVLIAVIVYLIVKKPKINNELLTKTQEMYKDSVKKNKELTQLLDEATKKSKVLESTNESIMKSNSALKDQLADVQNKYTDIQGELNDYKTRESQESEFKNAAPSKTKKEMFQERYNMINKPNPEHMKQEIEEVHDTLSDTGEIKLDTTGIAAQQKIVKEQMTNMIEPQNADLESVMKTLNE